MAPNITEGNRFERVMAEILSAKGFWVLRIPQNAGGQQPADLIAVKGRYHALIDCKVVSGDRFAFDRIEDNQHYAMGRFAQIGEETGWFAIRMPDGGVRMLDMESIEAIEENGQRSMNLKELSTVMGLEEWTKRANELCGSR